MFARNMIALTFALVLSASAAYAVENPALQADNQALASACAPDAAATGCSNEQLGHGMMKCMHAYKKANPAFKFSPACKAAAKKRHADKLAGKF